MVATAFAKLQQHLVHAQDENQRPPVELHFFGSGDPHLTAWLQEQPDINVHGESTPASMRAFLNNNRCAGLMLYQTGPRYRLLGTNSRKMFEYLATGAALIATGIGEVTQFVKTNDVGYLLPPEGTDSDLVAVFVDILAHPDRFARKCRNARQLMQKPTMNWEAQWQTAIDCGLLDGRVRTAIPLSGRHASSTGTHCAVRPSSTSTRAA